MFNFIKNIFCNKKPTSNYRYEPETDADELIFLLIEKTDFVGTFVFNYHEDINLRHSSHIDVYHIFCHDNTFYAVFGVDSYDEDGTLYMRSLYKVYKSKSDEKSDNFFDSGFPNDYECISHDVKICTGAVYFTEYVKNHRNNKYYNNKGEMINIVCDKKKLINEINFLKTQSNFVEDNL